MKGVVAAGHASSVTAPVKAATTTIPVAYLQTQHLHETSRIQAAVFEGAERLGITLITTLVEGAVDEQSIARAFAALPEWPNRVCAVVGRRFSSGCKSLCLPFN